MNFCKRDRRADAEHNTKICDISFFSTIFRTHSPVIDTTFAYDIIKAVNPIVAAGWSSPEARWAHNPKVVGSNPTPATSPGVYFSKKEGTYKCPLFIIADF